MRAICISLGTVLTGLLLPGAAVGGFFYSYKFVQDSYAVAPGEVFEVDVFLEEKVTGGDISRLATEGLIGAGVRVRFDVPPTPTDPAEVISLDDILPNTIAFDDSLFLFTDLLPGSYAGFSAVVDIASPAVFGTEVAPDTFWIFLGSFRFTVGVAAGETTIIQALDVPGIDDTVTGTGYVLDSMIQAAGATITAVPEPSSLLLMGMGAFGMIGALQRRRGDLAS